MKMNVVSYDSDNGIVSLDIDDEARDYLIEKGFNSILTESINAILKELEEKEEEIESQTDQLQSTTGC
jgi:hypothetical protein